MCELKFLENKESEYREHSGINQSALSLLDSDVREFKRKIIDGEKDEQKNYFNLGSLVDAFLTDPSKINSGFYVTEYKKPTEKLGEFCEELLSIKDNRIITTEELFSDEILLEARKNVDYLMHLKDVTFLNYFNNGGKYEDQVKGYIKALEDAGDLPIVDSEMLSLAETKAYVLKTHEFTKHVFNPIEGYEIYYQVPIYFKIVIKNKKYECKGLIDVLHVNKTKKTIRMYDVKTTSSTINQFKSSYIKFRYYLQASFYYNGVLTLIPGDYYVEMFEFVVIDSRNHVARIAPTPSDLMVGKSGGFDIFGNKVKGYEELITDLNYHIENDCWEYPADVYRTGGLESYRSFV